ncbi:MAG: MFS transporter [Microcoleus sp. SIO2G3]|nr:MFS transporter [Microcoleus sp. SIO2G3]
MLRDSRLIVLLLVGSLTSMVGGVVAPVLPEIVQQLDLNPGLAGNLVSMHCLTFAVFSPLLGILADRIGKLRVLIASLTFYAVFGMAGALMQSFWPLLIARGLIGATSGWIAAASLGLLGTMYEGEERSQVMGFATSTLTIASIIFPLLGGWVGSSHWQYVFYLYGLALLLIPPVALLFGRKSTKASQSIEIGDRQKLGEVLRAPQTLRLLLTLCLASATVYSVVVYAPMYLKATIGATSTVNGIVLASRAIGAAVISAFGARHLAKRFGMTGATGLGLGLMALTLMTIPVLRQLSQIIPTAVLFGFGFGTVMPTL